MGLSVADLSQHKRYTYKMSRTYLQHCLNKQGLLSRWPDKAMPIHVYVAPFTWYEKKKQQEATIYRQMILDALNTWRTVSNGKIKFQLVPQLTNSQIDFKWRRVDRKSLGHCTYEIDDKHRLFSASIEIGISDGVLHAEYQDIPEVKHTILHEIGHALGLTGHSDNPGDIMYVPHQYGVHTLSPRDIETINWLYQLHVGFNYKAIGAKSHLTPGFTFDQVIEVIEKGDNKNKDSKIPPEETSAEIQTSIPPEPERKSSVLRTQSLEEQHQILSEMGRFYLKTQALRQKPPAQDALKKATAEKEMKKRKPPEQPPS